MSSINQPTKIKSDEVRGPIRDLGNTCPPWCTLTEDHPNEAPADRTHFGPYQCSPATREHAQAVTAAVFVQQPADADTPTIWVGQQDKLGLILTVTEAAQLAANLLAAINEAGR